MKGPAWEGYQWGSSFQVYCLEFLEVLVKILGSEYVVQESW